MTRDKKDKVHQVALSIYPTVYKQLMETGEEDGLFQHDDWPTGIATEAYRMAEAFVEVAEAFEEKHK